MEILEYRGFQGRFFGFCKDTSDKTEIERYYLLYGKTGDPIVDCYNENATFCYHDTPFMALNTAKSTEITIPFLLNAKKHMLSLVSVKDKQDYDRLVQILEDIL